MLHLKLSCGIIFVEHLDFAMLSHGFSVMVTTLWCKDPGAICERISLSLKKTGFSLSFLPLQGQAET